MDKYIVKSSIPYTKPSTENLIKFLRDNLQANSEQIIIIDGASGRRWNGRNLELTICRVSRYLIDKCFLKKGQVVSIYEKDNDHVAIIILAVIAAGATCKFVPASIKDLVRTARVANSKYVISSSRYLLEIREELASENQDISFISIDGQYPLCGFPDCHYIGNILDIDSKGEHYTLDELSNMTNIDATSAIAVIQFSSGTTGVPKRIPRTHKNLCHLVASVDHKDLVNLKPGAIITGFLPMNFRTGMWSLLASIKSGACFVIKTYHEIEEIPDAIQKYKVTILSLPVMALPSLESLLQKPNGYDLSTLEEIMTAGSKLIDSNIPKSLVERLSLKMFRQCFGMTESGWVFLAERSWAKDRYLSVGHVVPGMEAIVVDPKNLTPLGPNEKGEIALRGPQIFPGYLTETPGVYNKSDFFGECWFRIGDEGYYTEEGLFYIVGRLKELLILRNLKKFYPDQIELILLEHPAVESACVINTKSSNEDIYDVARAFVILKKDSCINEKNLFDHVEKNAPTIILDGGIKIINSFPRLANGKIDKQALKLLH